MTNHPRTSIVIPNWNGMRFLTPCLSALRRQRDRDFHAVVVDNGSEDGSIALVREEFPEVQLVRLHRNRGFAAAVNAGIAVSAGTYVGFLNNDCVPDPNWLRELVACLERHPRAAAATSKLLQLDDPQIIDGAGDVVSSYLRAYERGRGERDDGQYDHEMEVFGASGAASVWRRDVLHRIGTFDEDFFIYYEDVDLSFRARLNGYECWYAPRAIARHAGAATTRVRAAEFAHFGSVRNRWAMILKDVPAALLLSSAPRLALGETLTIGRALREGQGRHLLRAYREILRTLPEALRRRRAVQARRVVSTRELRAALTPGYPRIRSRFVEVLRQRAPASAKF